MLTLVIKKKWFDMIDKGEKQEEYRDITPYYNSRLGLREGTEQEIRLRNGYSSSSPMLQITALITKGTGNPDWGASEGKEYWVLKIKSRERVLPETFIIKARRCKRCGGLLTSKQAVKDGYGHVCKMRAKEEEQAKQPDPNQLSLFGSSEPDNNILQEEENNGSNY